MGKMDPRVDAYITKSADFAKPILIHVRRLVHEAHPEVEESIKWGFPSFGRKGILCYLSAHKAHCRFGFWHRSMHAELRATAAAGQFTGQLTRLTTITDLPSNQVFTAWIVKAAQLNESGPKSPRPRARKKLTAPADLLAALKKHKKAAAAFEAMSQSHKNEYIQWITEAKREETRKKRIETTIEWLTEGKSRNWKNER
jgi:uncharacterized protein YdeI (YjbR/CyaY-like superfamily)